MDKPIAIFLVGIPASGKSTYANRPEYDNYIKISSDEYITHKANLHGMTYDEAFKKYRGNIKRYVNYSINECVKTEQSFIIDQTNTYQPARVKKLNLIPDTFIRRAVVFPIEYRDAIMRADIRFNKTGKFISHKVIRDFYDQFIYPSLSEGFDEIIEIIS